MAESSWPSPDNTRLVTDLQYEQMIAGYVPSGLLGSPGDTGVVTADGSGRHVIIRASKYGYVRGHVWYSGTSTFTKTVAANSSGNPRIDLVVLRLTRSTWNVTVEIVEGTPAASPSAPTVTTDLGSTGVFEIAVATVAVANGASVINSGDVADWAFYLDRSPLIGVAANRPASGAYVGQEYRSSDTGATDRWSGSAWHNPVPRIVAAKMSTTTLTSTGTEVALTSWTDGDATVTFRAGVMYKLELSHGQWNTGTTNAFFDNEVRVRKDVNSTSAQQLGGWRVAAGGGSAPIVDHVHVAYVHNATGADISCVLGLTVKKSTGGDAKMTGGSLVVFDHGALSRFSAAQIAGLRSTAIT